MWYNLHVVVASFCDIYDWDEIVDYISSKKDFFKRFLKMTGGIPSSQTIERVFSLIKPSELEKILTDFFLEYTHNNFKISIFHTKIYDFS